jgi:hypothetical protein
MYTDCDLTSRGQVAVRVDRQRQRCFDRDVLAVLAVAVTVIIALTDRVMTLFA